MNQGMYLCVCVCEGSQVYHKRKVKVHFHGSSLSFSSPCIPWNRSSIRTWFNFELLQGNMRYILYISIYLPRCFIWFTVTNFILKGKYNHSILSTNTFFDPSNVSSWIHPCYELYCNTGFLKFQIVQFILKDLRVIYNL